MNVRNGQGRSKADVVAAHLQRAIRHLLLAIYAEASDFHPIAESLVDGTIGQNPHLVAMGHDALARQLGNGQMPSTMRTLLRVLEIPEPAPTEMS